MATAHQTWIDRRRSYGVIFFKYLMDMEELEYHLDSDIEVHGKPYSANPDSRGNTAEFAAVAVDAVRKLTVLQGTKVFWEKTGHTLKQDRRVLAGTTDKDFQDFQLNLQKAALRNTSITELIGQARAQGATAVQKALQHVLMRTTNAPKTEGNKVVIRHMGQTMNERFGPFSSFFTTNFADTYHVLTQVLAHGASEPLDWRPLNISQDSPPMATSQTMHKIVSTRPMVQAKLFLHLDASRTKAFSVLADLFWANRSMILARSGVMSLLSRMILHPAVILGSLRSSVCLLRR